MGELSRLLAIASEARRRLVRVLLVLAPIFGFLVTFRLQPFTLQLGPLAIPLAYPFPDIFQNVTAQVFRGLRSLTLPSDVTLLNVGVGDSILVQMEIGLLL